jgi:hypothetical protein
MDRHPTIASPSDLVEQIFPSRELSAYLPLRQLEQEGAQGLGDLFQALEGEEAVGITNRAPEEAVEPLEGTSLMHFYMASWMKRDRPAIPPVRMNAQGDLLRHSPAHEEGGSRHSE